MMTELTRILSCRSCNSRDLFSVLDLGKQRLADFRDTDEPTDAYPLEVLYCGGCHLVQLRDSVPPALMYHDRYGFKSGVNDTIRADLRSIVDDGFRLQPAARCWLDIASNDGTLLSFVHGGVFTVGVDPVTVLCDEAREHAEVIVNDYFAAGHVIAYGPFDVITSISMFYDLDDPNEFVAGVKSVLADDGIWIVQQNYLGATLEWNAVDNICHEHREYYSLLAMESLLARHGLEIFDVSTSSVNGGSFRTLICRTGDRPIAPSVADLRLHELAMRLDSTLPYEAFAQHVRSGLDDLHDLVTGLNAQGKRVWIYGASTRGGTLWQSASLTAADLPFAVDRNPAKVGKYMSSLGSLIISEEQARAEQPEYMVVSPWFFRDEFLQREAGYLNAGGRLIFPLPELEIVSQAQLVAA